MEKLLAKGKYRVNRVNWGLVLSHYSKMHQSTGMGIVIDERKIAQTGFRNLTGLGIIIDRSKNY